MMRIMRWLKSSSAKVSLIATLVLLLAIPAGKLYAVDKRAADRLGEAKYSLIGIRLGTWIDQGGKIRDVNVTADFPSASFYTELFYDLRLAPPLFMELSLGVAGRGDAVFISGNDRYIGTINLYPVLLQLKISPLARRSPRVQPFLIGGGGLVFGKQNTDIIRSLGPYLNPYYAEQSETNLTAVVGAGVDLALSDQIGLNITGKYHSITFGNKLAGIKDYSGTAISVGAAYFLHKKLGSANHGGKHAS